MILKRKKKRNDREAERETKNGTRANGAEAAEDGEETVDPAIKIVAQTVTRNGLATMMLGNLANLLTIAGETAVGVEGGVVEGAEGMVLIALLMSDPTTNSRTALRRRKKTPRR